MNNFIDELSALINRHCKENETNTPDFILGQYLSNCLDAFKIASNAREEWYGHKHTPGQSLNQTSTENPTK